MQKPENQNQILNQKASSLISAKLIFGIVLIVFYLWLISVAISKERQFAPIGDPTFDSKGRLDWTRTTTRTYITGTRTAWSGKHTLILLLTVGGTFVYWKTYFSK